MVARPTPENASTPEIAEDPLAGTPYRAIGPLGRGGMGEVLEAEHRGLRKRVVVKLLHRHFAGDPRFADRVRVEAQALAAVSSPHVVAVLDLGETPSGRPYLVMERLRGGTLRDELSRRGPLPVADAIRIAQEVLAGLDAAHRVGIVHRDVKLDNVFLSEPDDGGAPVAKVLDFGVAKILGTPSSPPPVAGPRYPTEEGMLVGTPRTVSPEQARFERVDARADVYAVGLLLYTLLVGHGPFVHVDDVLAVLNAHLREAPAPPSRYAKQPIPAELDRAVLKALAKRPEHRFQSAALFAEELGRIGGAALGATGPLPAPASVPAPARAPVDAAPPMDAELGAWFAPLGGDTPVAELPANLAPAEARANARVFAALTLVSTVVFSWIAALLLRRFGGW